MEIRVWQENGDLVGYCEIKPKGEEYELTVYPPAGPSIDVPFASEDGAKHYAHGICEKWKEYAEKEFEQMHGEKPVGVMSETGFTIQEVE